MRCDVMRVAHLITTHITTTYITHQTPHTSHTHITHITHIPHRHPHTQVYYKHNCGCEPPVMCDV